MPADRKGIVDRILSTGCSWCESELNIPNVSNNHGICSRHMETAFGMKDDSENPTPDLSQISPEDVELAIKLTKIRRDKTAGSEPLA